ncbi:uncharacterized protein BCR38DRAFT_406991 [Pseudomassariella vexata]|uniref:Uncharacterized protein n=1 Tax=Pseudomassariella vexata TaxID=1141098 RepID=A0A1Y2E5Y2_9PEZI|nr:uncharacterized protein BCR38DRAFT_406991 [Pseudomassariella vexata]ORY66968.1 hypothetical protein BCR38DRAFT_406991 [Pseudomassariella vexata]
MYLYTAVALSLSLPHQQAFRGDLALAVTAPLHDNALSVSSSPYLRIDRYYTGLVLASTLAFVFFLSFLSTFKLLKITTVRDPQHVQNSYLRLGNQSLENVEGIGDNPRQP